MGPRNRAPARASFGAGTRRSIPPARPRNFRKSALPRFHNPTPAVASRIAAFVSSRRSVLVPKMPKIGHAMAHFRLDDGFTALPSGITELLQRLLRVAASLISHRDNQRDGRRRVAIQLEDLKKKQAAENEINWVTASFMMLFHVGAIVALFFFT